ncbi:unnamed protein product [Rhodiola kirilowii]
MRLIGWNCRGAVRALKEVLRSCQPRVIGLIETTVNKGRWESLKSQLKFEHCFVVDVGGGLALLWKEDLEVSIQSYSTYHIDALIREEEEFRATVTQWWAED